MKVRFWGVRGSLPVPGPENRPLRRQHVVRRGALGVRDARHHRRRHRHPQARQGADAGERRSRPGPRAPADQPHPLGPHPGAAVLRAAVPARATRCRCTPASATTCTCGRCSRRRPTTRISRCRSTRPRPTSRSTSCSMRRSSTSKTSRWRARGSTTRGSRSRTGSTADGASVVYVTDTAPFTDILFEHEFIARPPTLGAELPAKPTTRSWRRCATAWCACARAPTWSSTTRSSRPRTTSACPHWGHSRPDDAIEICARRRASSGWRCSTTRPSAPTPRSTRSWPTRAPLAAKTARELDIVRGATKGLEVERRAGLMELTFWGVRGSIPAPGPATDRYGGNTSCVSLRPSSGGLIMLDCGTGARNLGHHADGRRVRQGRRRGEHPAVARALGPHPGLPVLRAAVPAGQQVPHLRRREELVDAGGHPRGADGAAIFRRCRR